MTELPAAFFETCKLLEHLKLLAFGFWLLAFGSWRSGFA